MKCRLIILMMVCILSIISLIGCGKDNVGNGSTPTKTKISSFYKENTGTIERIEMLSAAGEKKSITNQENIEQWQEQIGEIIVTLNASPEDHSGSLFIVTLFSKGQEVLRLTPTSINGTAIIANQELVDRMTELWSKDS